MTLPMVSRRANAPLPVVRRERKQYEEDKQQKTGLGKAQGVGQDSQDSVDEHPDDLQGHGDGYFARLWLYPTGRQKLGQEPAAKPDGGQQTNQCVGASQRADENGENQAGVGEVHSQAGEYAVEDAQRVVAPVHRVVQCYVISFACFCLGSCKPSERATATRLQANEKRNNGSKPNQSTMAPPSGDAKKARPTTPLAKPR